MTTDEVSAIRSALEQTGDLFTKDADDPGHIPAFWRKKIEELLKAHESGLLPVADAAQASSPHERLDALVTAARGVLLGDLEAKLIRATWLVNEARPRMETLNNEFSLRSWLPIAERFLAGRQDGPPC